MDFANDENGDLDLKNGDFYFVTGADAVVQFLNQKLRLWLSEWFLDESLGFPYFDKVFIKNPNMVELSIIFKKQILECPGVIELKSFTLTIDTTIRKLTVAGDIRASDDERSFSVSQIIPGGA